MLCRQSLHCSFIEIKDVAEKERKGGERERKRKARTSLPLQKSNEKREETDESCLLKGLFAPVYRLHSDLIE